MNAVLALPRIAPAVPTAVVPSRRRCANAGLARFLIEAGAVSAADVPARWTDALDVCERALDAWIRRRIGPLRCLSPLFVLTVGDDARYGEPERDPEQGYGAARLVWQEANLRPWAVGAGLEALEREQPGLGGAVLDLLTAQQAAYPLFTPEIACEQVCYLHWSGEDNEEDALDAQCGPDPQERAEMREAMITRASLDAAFPAWAQRRRALMARERRPGLKRLARGVRDPSLRGIVDDALALSRLRVGQAFWPEEEGQFMGWGAVLTWAEDDLAIRIYDDLCQYAYQSEYCEEMGAVDLPLDQPAVFSHWRKAMASRCRAIGLIDRLIHALSAGDWS